MNKIEKLTHLITILEKIPAKDFNIDTWRCGTQGCALGWAACDPKFNEQGLDLTNWQVPLYDESLGIEAGSEFFEITLEESEFLFDPEMYCIYDLEDIYSPFNEVEDMDDTYYPDIIQKALNSPNQDKMFRDYEEQTTVEHVIARVQFLIELENTNV